MDEANKIRSLFCSFSSRKVRYTAGMPDKIWCSGFFIVSILILLFLLVTSILYAFADNSKNPEKSNYVPEQIIVKFKEGVNPQVVLQQAGIKEKTIERVHLIKPVVAKFKKELQQKKTFVGVYQIRGKSYRTLEEIPENDIFDEAYSQMDLIEKSLYRKYIIKLLEGASVEETISILQKNPGVEYSHPNYTMKVLIESNDPYYPSSGSWGQTYDDLWGLKKIQANDAWNISEGQDVVVAVIDTGVDYNHEDISGNMWTNQEEIPGNGIDEDGNGYVDDYYGLNPSLSNGDVLDKYYHGTYVAGIIAAVGNNGKGIIGMAPKAKIMALKCNEKDIYGKDTSSINFLAVARGITYAVNKDNRVKVINCSFVANNTSLIDEILDATKKNCVVVAGVGNEKLDINNDWVYPACNEQVIAVGATDIGDKGWEYNIFNGTNFDSSESKISVAAPGQEILSLLSIEHIADLDNPSVIPPVWLIPQNTPKYLCASGTSAAAPFVSGVAALLLSKYPNLKPYQIKEIIERSADTIYAFEDSHYKKAAALGKGRINAFKAVTYLNNNFIPVDNQSPIIEECSISPLNLINWNDTYTITCKFRDRGNPLSGIDPSSETLSIDGNVIDAKRLYQSSTQIGYADKFIAGFHTVKVVVGDFAGNKTTKEWQFRINSDGTGMILLPDLVLSDIGFSNVFPSENDIVTIIARVSNKGWADVSFVPVGFYLDDTNNPIINPVMIGPLNVYGGTAGKMFEVQQGVSWKRKYKELPENERKLYFTDSEFKLFGSTDITLHGNNRDGGENYDDGCVKVEISAWQNVDEARITKITTTSPNYIEVYAKVHNTTGRHASEGHFKANITITGKKDSAAVPVQINWKAKVGQHKIITVVDPDRQILESDKSNNSNFGQITVIANKSPAIPILSGPVNGVISRSYPFTASASDPEHQKIKFVFDWGDGVIHETGYLDYAGQNVTGTLQHAWNSAGTYNVKVKAVDEGGKESEWSDPLSMNIQNFSETNWVTTIIEKGQHYYNPVLSKDNENNVYCVSTQYRPATGLYQTAFQFLKSTDEGKSFSYESLPWAWLIDGQSFISPELTVNLNNYKHTVYAFNDDIYYGAHIIDSQGLSEVSLSILDKKNDGGTPQSTYICKTPGIVSYGSSLAAVWIRKENMGWSPDNTNEDHIIVQSSVDNGKYWRNVDNIGSGDIGSGYDANPAVVIDNNGDLLIATCSKDDWADPAHGNKDHVFGIKFHRLAYSIGGWLHNDNVYPSVAVYSQPVYYNEGSFPDYQPRMCVDKFNIIHMVFDYHTTNELITGQEPYSIYYAMSFTGEQGSWILNYVGLGKRPDIAVDRLGKIHIVCVLNSEVYYISPEGKYEVISSVRGKVKDSSPRIVCTDNYVHVTWRENEEDGTNSVYYSRLKLSQFEISGVHCTPNPERATALLDVLEYDQSMPPYFDFLPDQLWISFAIKNALYRQHKINIEIFTDDGVTLVKKLVLDQPESLDIDPLGGYSKQFVNYAMWDGHSDVLFPDPYGKPWNGYVPPGFTWKIKITAQEIDDNGNPGKTTTNWVDWNGWNLDHRIIPKSYLSMDADGTRKGLRAVYNDGTVIEGEGPLDHGRRGLPSIGSDLTSYYQGLPGDWAGKWDINGIFREILNGYIYAPTTGEYKFKLVVDDYGALVVNGWVICTYDNPEAPGQVFGNIPLEGGKWYPIYIEYENRKGSNGFGLYWNVAENQNFIFTDPTFIQTPQKDIKAFLEFLEGNTGFDNEKKDNPI